MHDQGPGTPSPAGQPNLVTTAPRTITTRISQLPIRELDVYSNQLALCLQAASSRSSPTRRCGAAPSGTRQRTSVGVSSGIPDRRLSSSR
jgi:hypothetical protein